MGKTIAELEAEIEQVVTEMQDLNAEVPELINDTDVATASDREKRLAMVDQRRCDLYHRRQSLAVALRFAKAWGPDWDRRQ